MTAIVSPEEQIRLLKRQICIMQDEIERLKKRISKMENEKQERIKEC